MTQSWKHSMYVFVQSSPSQASKDHRPESCVHKNRHVSPAMLSLEPKQQPCELLSWFRPEGLKAKLSSSQAAPPLTRCSSKGASGAVLHHHCMEVSSDCQSKRKSPQQATQDTRTANLRAVRFNEVNHI